MMRSSKGERTRVPVDERPNDDFAAVDATVPQRECDVVMKGGITSGVIYPLAICQLATRFRLVNIGGTSAGAIAAAATAAAELGRQRMQTDADIAAGGFRRLAALPAELGDSLASLFQPSPATRPLFRVMLNATRAPARPAGTEAGERGKTFGGKILPILRAVTAVRLGWVLAGLVMPVVVAAAALWFGRPVSLAVTLVTLVLALLLGFVVGLALAAWSLYRVLARAVPKNYFGICTGMGDDPPGLTPWLSDLLDELSGNATLPDDERHPLTFGDLWGEKAVKAYRSLYAREQEPSIAELTQTQAARDINLEVMSTDLSNGRPYRLPTTVRGLLFCPKEMAELFPETVVAHMMRAPSTSPNGDRPTGRNITCPQEGHEDQHLHDLPLMPDLPVVVAARMSLSFPLLISAVPLYRVDDLQDGAPVVKCWFSDGGITSNFPVHFFDSLVPRRPTFGVNLRTHAPDHAHEDVYLPPPVGPSERTRWRPINSVTSFGSTIMDTMQNWSDEGQTTLPGFRDRIVHVALSPEEGGMNLDMPRDRIKELSNRGRDAARRLTGDVPAGIRRFDWDNHRWTRYRTAMAKLEQALEQLADTCDDSGDDGFARFLQVYQPQHYVGYTATEWLAFNQAALEELLQVGRAWRQSRRQHTDHAPEPNPDLRMTPRF